MRERLAQGDDARLDGVVGGHAGRVHEPGERGGVDDVPAALLLEQRRERAAAADDAEQVDVDDPVPLVHRRDVDASARGDAGVVDEQVEATPRLAHVGERRGPCVVAAHVERDVCRRLGQRVGPVGLQVGREHVVTAGDQGAHESESEPGRTAGDEDASRGRRGGGAGGRAGAERAGTAYAPTYWRTVSVTLPCARRSSISARAPATSSSGWRVPIGGASAPDSRSGRIASHWVRR